MQNNKIRLEDMICNLGGSALDFGCGDGFRVKEYCHLYKDIVCFDYPQVINQYRDRFKDIKNVKLESNWEYLKNNKFDEIISHLVFQHMHPDTLQSYLRDMSKMTKSLLFATRENFNPYLRSVLNFENDFILPYVEKYFNIIEVNRIEYPELLFVHATPK